MARPRLKRLLRISLRVVFVLTAFLCIWLGWKMHRVKQQKEVVAWVRQMGGSVTYDCNGLDPFAEGLGWLREQFGIDFFDRVITVDLEGEKITDISPLAGLRSVRNLYLEDTMVSDLSPLVGMTNLTCLKITGGSSYNWVENQWEFERTPVKDLSPLAKNKRIRRLCLNVTSVSDLTPLAGVTNLRHLELINSPVSDLSPLSGLTSLRSLNLSGTSVSDLLPLANMKYLERLDLQSVSVTDLSPLAGLTGIKWLNLNDTSAVRDISALTGMKGIEYLNLSFSSVSNLSPLTGMLRLAELDVGGTRVTDLSPLVGLTSLKELNVVCMSLDLAPLNDLTRVTVVLGGPGNVVIPEEMQSRVLFSTGYSDVTRPTNQ